MTSTWSRESGLQVRKAPPQRAPAQLLVLLESQLPKPHTRRTDKIQVRLHLFACSFATARSGQAF